MKTLFVIGVLMLCGNVSAQDTIECATALLPGITVQQAQSGNLVFHKRTTLTDSLRLAVHIVCSSNGAGAITASNLNAKIAALNNHMSQASFAFKIFSVDTIRNDDFDTVWFYPNDSLAFAETNRLKRINSKAHCINVYFVPSANFNGLSSFSERLQGYSYWGEMVQGIIIWNSAPTTSLPHEIGHYFDLFHPTMRYFEDENIARSGSCSNWAEAGDLLEDTPADPTERVKCPTIDSVNCLWSSICIFPQDGCGATNYAP